MTGLARVDELRRLPPSRAARALHRLEAELGPEGVAALGTAWDFWRRPAQRFPAAHERQAIVVFTGDYGAGKTRCAWEYLIHLVLIGRGKGPRIIGATGADARRIVEHKLTGILAWRKPGVVYQWESSKGFEGELWVNGALITLMSVEAPRTALGDGADVQLLDDPPKWGATGKAALVAALKSARERGALTIIPTTADGLALLREVLGDDLTRAGVLVIDLGGSEANAGNLDPNYFVTKAALERAGLWSPVPSGSPWAPVLATMGERLRLLACPPLVEMGIGIDPNLSAGDRACECGIIGGGRDARSTVHIRHDKSAVLDSGVNGWPRVAWDLAVQMVEAHPGVPWRFVLEKNTGTRLQELLRGEERARRRRGERVPSPTGGWLTGNAEVSVCEIHLIRSDKDKCKRAESPARLAAQEQVRVAPDLRDLEQQLRDLKPAGTKSDRADACVHLINDLAGLAEAAPPDLAAQAKADFEGLAEAQQGIPRPLFDTERA